MRRWLVTGAAGFIGYHLSERLLAQDIEVVGVDNLNAYYDVSLKEARLSNLHRHQGFHLERIDIRTRGVLDEIFEEHSPEVVVHLAAQPGVRYSMVDPHSYVENNLDGFLNVLEACRKKPVGHLIFASSSSVYGTNSRLPFSARDGVNHPVSLYAATKRANELMAHSYSHLYGIPATGLRFFSVYGPWGRPDMAYFTFAKAILAGEPIAVYGDGSYVRDFTYVDDVTEVILRVAGKPPAAREDWSGGDDDPSISFAPFQLFNIGHGSQISIAGLIEILERYLGKPATRRYEPEQPGELKVTQADVDDLLDYVGFKPQVGIEQGLRAFTDWLQGYNSGTR